MDRKLEGATPWAEAHNPWSLRRSRSLGGQHLLLGLKKTSREYISLLLSCGGHGYSRIEYGTLTVVLGKSHVEVIRNDGVSVAIENARQTIPS